MGEAKRKRQRREESGWPYSESFWGTIDLHMLAPVKEIDGARIRELTGDNTIPNAPQIILEAYLESVGPPELREGWEPEITIFAANGRGE